MTDRLDQEIDYSNEALRKLGARIRHLRRKKAMTQRDLSFEGCSYSYLARIEAGDRRPSPRVLIEIARRLEVSPEELTGEVAAEQRGRSLEILDAMMMIRLERYEEAEELLRGVLREAEVDADAQRISEATEGMGLIAARRGRDEQALKLLERAIEIGDPPHPAQRPDLYIELARLYLASGDPARAIAIMDECADRLRKQPGRDQAKLVRYTLLLSQAYADAGDYGSASSVLAEALRDGAEEIDLPSRARAYYSLSRLYATTGHVSQAIAYADRALAIYELVDDNDALSDAHLLYAQNLLDAAETERAATHLAAARSLLGSRPSAVDLGFLVVEEARLALQQGDRPLAGSRAREAVELLGNAAHPGQLGDAYLVLARVYDDLGETDRAEWAYTAAIDAIQKQNGWTRELAKAYRWYGKFLKRMGRAEAALEAFELAADLAPSNQDALSPTPQSGWTPSSVEA
ncbi:MAG: helix-turn-helix domain-containing protein [Gaiellales bacterium]